MAFFTPKWYNTFGSCPLAVACGAYLETAPGAVLPQNPRILGSKTLRLAWETSRTAESEGEAGHLPHHTRYGAQRAGGRDREGESRMKIPVNCKLCPRECGSDRRTGIGFCGGGAQVKVARAALHFWEEPCISGKQGSGTVFFSGCPLKCCFCQNYTISAQNFGKEIPVSRLAEIFLELQEQGAHNINLVNPMHFAPWVAEALEQVRGKLKIPVVCNTGGYDKVQTLRMLEGYVDIYLPDLKYADSARAGRYSCAPDYFAVAQKSITEMVRQVGPPVFGPDGMLQKGVVIRHLALPHGVKDSIQVLQWIAQQFAKGEVLLSLMSQYTPFFRSGEFPEINRRISSYEYGKVLSYAAELGLEGYCQEKSSAKEEYTPDFDLQGV